MVFSTQHAPQSFGFRVILGSAHCSRQKIAEGLDDLNGRCAGVSSPGRSITSCRAPGHSPPGPPADADRKPPFGNQDRHAQTLMRLLGICWCSGELPQLLSTGELNTWPRPPWLVRYPHDFLAKLGPLSGHTFRAELRHLDITGCQRTYWACLTNKRRYDIASGQVGCRAVVRRR
jgi:hypothetical protein